MKAFSNIKQFRRSFTEGLEFQSDLRNDIQIIWGIVFSILLVTCCFESWEYPTVNNIKIVLNASPLFAVVVEKLQYLQECLSNF
jgi:hypothetical protein